MTEKTINPNKFGYLTDAEKAELIFAQLRTVFDSKLIFQQYTIEQMKSGMRILSITFNIMTQYDEILKVVYRVEKNTITILDMTKRIAAHMLSNQLMADVQQSLIKIIKRYALKNLFNISTVRDPNNLENMVTDLLLQRSGIFIDIHKESIEYSVVFFFNVKTIRLILKLKDNVENKMTLVYSKTVKRKSKYNFITEYQQTVKLLKAPVTAFEQCFYDLYLKAEYNITRKNKDALKVIEMMVI